jgi:hypothetical protein
MTNTVTEAKAMLENMLQNYSQRHTERAPTTSTQKVSSIEEVENISANIDVIAMMAI